MNNKAIKQPGLINKTLAQLNMKKNKIFLQVGDAGFSFIKKQRDFFKKEYNMVFYNLLDNSVKKNKVLIKKLEDVYEELIFCDFSDSISIFNSIKEII